MLYIICKNILYYILYYIIYNPGRVEGGKNLTSGGAGRSPPPARPWPLSQRSSHRLVQFWRSITRPQGLPPNHTILCRPGGGGKVDQCPIGLSGVQGETDHKWGGGSLKKGLLLNAFGTGSFWWFLPTPQTGGLGTKTSRSPVTQ